MPMKFTSLHTTNVLFASSQAYENYRNIFCSLNCALIIIIVLCLENLFVPQEVSDDQDTRKITKVSLPWVEQGDWKIPDKSSAEKFHCKLRRSSRRPACVTITGSNWEEADLCKLFKDVSTISCPVNLNFDDAFENSPETTFELISYALANNKQ